MKYLMILGCVPEGIELAAESLALMYRMPVEIRISAVITTDSPDAARAMESLYGAYQDVRKENQKEEGKQ
jgi:hypothetical protein